MFLHRNSAGPLTPQTRLVRGENWCERQTWRALEGRKPDEPGAVHLASTPGSNIRLGHGAPLMIGDGYKQTLGMGGTYPPRVEIGMIPEGADN